MLPFFLLISLKTFFFFFKLKSKSFPDLRIQVDYPQSVSHCSDSVHNLLYCRIRGFLYIAQDLIP